MGRDLCALALLMFATAACVGELELTGSGGGGDGDGDGDGATAAEMAFIEDVAPALAARTCTACHAQSCATSGNNNCFLGTASPDDDYETLLGSVFIGPTAATSSLLTVGNHVTNDTALPGGPAFCSGPGNPDAGCTTNQVAAISAWIELEAGAP